MASSSLNNRTDVSAITGAADGASLVVGGDSLIGQALAAALAADGEAVFATTRRRDQVGPRRPYLDLDRPEWDEAALRPCATAYLCAAIARLNACSADPDAAMRVNARHMIALGSVLASAGCYVLLLSTNQVFDGSKRHPRPSDPVSPTTAYGRSKVAAEQGVLALSGLAPPCVAPGVLRLSKVVNPGMPLLLDWIGRFRRGETVSAAADMTLAPLPLDQVVRTMRAMAARRMSGIVHLSAGGEITYVDAARHIARRVGASPALVRPVNSVAAGFLTEPPPRYTALADERTMATLGVTPVDPFDALDACIRDALDDPAV